jgi:organic hydroperoxide reductase OsmC/OhrA
VIKRIHADYRLKVAPGEREAAQRVHDMHADFCPVARSFKGCIEITTSLTMEDV